MRLLSIGVAVLALAGCASTPGNLAQPDNAASFELERGYQEALRDIAAGTRECPPPQFLPLGQQINDTQHYPDLREGRITLGASGVGTSITQVVDVKEIAPGRTRVTVYAQHPRTREVYVERAKRWAAGDMSCSD